MWLERRAEQEFPLGITQPLPEPERASLGAQASTSSPSSTFVLEVGTEELPPDDVQAAIQQLR